MDRDTTPSVKGFILESLWADLRAFLDQGRLSRKEGERLLGAESVLGRFVDGVSGQGGNAGRALMKFPDLMLNYGRWEFESPRRGEFTVHLRDAAPLPDSFRLSIQGAGEVIGARLAGAPVDVASRRPSKGYVVFEGRFARSAPR